MEVGESEEQLLILSGLGAALIVLLPDVSVGPLQVGLETSWWLVGELDSTLQNRHREYRSGHRGEPESILRVHAVLILQFLELLGLGMNANAPGAHDHKSVGFRHFWRLLEVLLWLFEEGVSVLFGREGKHVVCVGDAEAWLARDYLAVVEGDGIGLLPEAVGAGEDALGLLFLEWVSDQCLEVTCLCIP